MDNLQNYRYSMDSCNHCGQCKWLHPSQMQGWDFSEACPVHQYYGFDAYSGQGYLNIAKEVLEGVLPYGDGLEEMIGSCTLCGVCDVNCKSVRDIEVLDTILALREDCAKRGTLPEAFRALADNIAQTGNIYGEPAADRFSWLPEGFKDTPDADTALFIGCAAAYRHKEIAQAAVSVLQALEIPFCLLYEEESCCGIHLWQTGLTEAFENRVRELTERLKKRGIRRIVTACGECCGAFKGGYPRVAEFPFEVLHISEIAEKVLSEKQLRLSPTELSGTVTYHDPCLLGRRSELYVPWNGEQKPFGVMDPPKQWRRGENGIYDAPRNLIRAIPGITLTEMTRHAEEAWCCGGTPSALKSGATEFAAEERRREAAAAGAEAMISCCPFCEDALTKEGADGVVCHDLTVLLAQALSGKEE